MRIRTNLFVTLDGRVSDADGRPVQLLMPAFAGAVSYGLPEFLAETDAVVMGRTTFLPALGAPRWPWTQPVFVLTSTPLPKNTPSDVTTASTVAELVEAMRAAGIERDVHLVGGPSTTHAFRDAGALDELWLHVVPLVLGAGLPLAQRAIGPLATIATRTFPDGVIEVGYTVA
jgi:dihydrofolate reductase